MRLISTGSSRSAGIKGLENLAQVLRPYSTAGIADPNGRHGTVRAAIVAIDKVDGDSGVVRAVLGGVLQKIENDLHQSASVSHDTG